MTGIHLFVHGGWGLLYVVVVGVHAFVHGDYVVVYGVLEKRGVGWWGVVTRGYIERGKVGGGGGRDEGATT